MLFEPEKLRVCLSIDRPVGEGGLTARYGAMAVSLATALWSRLLLTKCFHNWVGGASDFRDPMNGCRVSQSCSPAGSPGTVTLAGTLWLATVLLLTAEKRSGCCLPGPGRERAVEFGLEWLWRSCSGVVFWTGTAKSKDASSVGGIKNNTTQWARKCPL